MCYDHVGGLLGGLLRDVFVKKGWIARARPADKHYYITRKGKAGFAKLGIDLEQIKPDS